MPFPPAPIVAAVTADDSNAAGIWLAANRQFLDPALPEGHKFLAWAMTAIQSQEMLDRFLESGLNVASVSALWAPGYCVERIPGWIAEHLVKRGAVLTPNAAAAMGLAGLLREILERRPEAVQDRGFDGTRPLHIARTVDIAQLLLDHGADVDVRDDDHDSTAAQWRIGDAPEVTRLLLGRGAQSDLFMAAGLGDLELARRLIRENPVCTTHRIGHNNGPFPGIGSRGRGGSIYQWTLGFNQSPHEIAWHRGHRELFDVLWDHTPPRSQLLVACMLADRERATAVLASSPGLIGELDVEDRALLAKSCWETNLNLEAVRLMLDLGFPVDVPECNHGYLPLHNAAWCGAPELVELLLSRGHPVDRRDPSYHSTALGFALHSALVARRHPEGDFPRVVQLLLEAGTPLDEGRYPTGDAAIDAIIQQHLSRRMP